MKYTRNNILVKKALENLNSNIQVVSIISLGLVTQSIIEKLEIYS